jgi:3-methyladenine DNA glycosylase AlkD
MMEMTDKTRDAVTQIHSDLLRVCSEKMRQGQQRYFKETVTFIGCSLPQCTKIAGEWSKKLNSEAWTYDEVLKLAESLLQAGSWEEGAVGLELVQKRRRDFRESDFEVFEEWMGKYIGNWAHTDSIAPHIIGELVKMYPSLAARVFEWTRSDNRWMRRASAVTYVLLARHGEFHEWVFKTADELLGDEDDMVRKGVGWMLKCTSQSDEQRVVDYLLKNRGRASRLVLRYASEKMTPEHRQLILK